MSQSDEFRVMDSGLELGWEELDEPLFVPAEIVPDGFDKTGANADAAATSTDEVVIS